MGLQGVVICFASRKSDGFDSRMLHYLLRYDIIYARFVQLVKILRFHRRDASSSLVSRLAYLPCVEKVPRIV